MSLSAGDPGKDRRGFGVELGGQRVARFPGGSANSTTAPRQPMTAMTATMAVPARTARRMRERRAEVGGVGFGGCCSGGRFLGQACHFFGVAQLLLAPFFFFCSFWFSASRDGCQVVAGGLPGEAVVVSGLGGQCFGVGKPGAGEQPVGVVVVGAPGGGGAFDVVGGDQVWRSSRSQPARSFHWRSRLSRATSTTTSPPRWSMTSSRFSTNASISGRLSLGQVAVTGDPAHGLVVVGVDGGQPRDERRPQRRELTAALLRVGGKHLVDGGLHHPLHAAHRLVAGQGQLTGGGVSVVEPAQGQRQQRQRVPTLGGILEQSVDQIGSDAQRSPPALARSAGPVMTSRNWLSGMGLRSSKTSEVNLGQLRRDSASPHSGRCGWCPPRSGPAAARRHRACASSAISCRNAAASAPASAVNSSSA